MYRGQIGLKVKILQSGSVLEHIVYHGVSLSRGGLFPGGLCPGGVFQGDPPSPVNRMTDIGVKTLPSRNFVCGR